MYFDDSNCWNTHARNILKQINFKKLGKIFQNHLSLDFLRTNIFVVYNHITRSGQISTCCTVVHKKRPGINLVVEFTLDRI